ncbi:MAG: transglycosylase SLT domain-containing protein [Bacillota bacterium]
MGFGDVGRYNQQGGFADVGRQRRLDGFASVGLRQTSRQPKKPTSPTLTAASTNVNLEKRLQAAGVPVPEQKPKQNLLTKALDILDRPGAAVRGALMAGYQGQGASQALAAAKRGFRGQAKVRGSDIIAEAARRGAPLAQSLQKSKTGRFVGGVAAEILLDPTTYLTVGTSRVAVTGGNLAKAIQREVAKETGKKISSETAYRLAANAEAGNIPVGRLGTAINRAIGRQAETRLIRTGIGKLGQTEKRTTMTSQAKGFAAGAEELLRKAKEMRKGKLPIAGALPPGPTKPDFVAGYNQVVAPRRFAIKPTTDRLDQVIKAIAPEVERQSQQAIHIRNLIDRYGTVPIESKHSVVEFLKQAVGIPSGRLKKMGLPQLTALAETVARGADAAETKYAMAKRVANNLGYNLDNELALARMEPGELLRHLAEQGRWKAVVGEKPIPGKVAEPPKVNVPYVEAMPKAAPARVTNIEARKLGREMAQPLEATAKEFLKRAKELKKQARAVPVTHTVARVTNAFGPAAAARTTVRFMGTPLIDVTPIRTALGAVIEKSPHLTTVRDALGRVFKFNYTPQAIKGVERALVTAAKERVTQAVREVPYAREKGMREVAGQWEGVSKEAAELAPDVIQQTIRGTPQARKAAEIASKMFDEDVARFAQEGIPLNILDNYVMHLYTDPPEKVKAAIDRWRQMHASRQAVGARPSFTKRRTIPTLEEARALGLHPIQDVRQLTMIHRALTEQAVALQKMGRDLVRMGRDVVSDTNPGGWVNVTDSAIPALKGKWLHPEVAKALANLYPVIQNTDEGVRNIARAVDYMTRSWKALVLFRPAFHLRNFIGNVFLNVADGMLNPLRYPQAAAVLAESLPYVELAGRQVPTKVVKEWFAREALRGQGMFQEAAGTRTVTEEAARMLDALQRNGFQHVAYWTRHPFEASRAFGEHTDSLGRMANFLHHLDRGLSPAEAAQRTRLALFDYGALTPAEQQIRRWLIPFYAWTRFALPKMVEKLIGAPGIFTGAAHVRENAVSINEVDEQNIPQWLRDAQAIPLWVDAKGQIHYLPLNLPLTELARIHEFGEVQENVKELAMLANPIFTTLAQLAFNRSLLTDRKITEFGEIGGPQMWKDYGMFALNQMGPVREVASQIRAREEERKMAQDLAAGKMVEVPPLERGPLEKFGMGSVQHPARWARAAEFARKEQLEQAKKAAELQGITVPETEELPPSPGEPQGFASVGVSRNRAFGFGAVGNAVFKQAGEPPAVVRQAMEMAGVDPSWGPYLKILMQAESGGNPLARNPQPVRTRHGQEHATGLFQTLPSTFRAHAVPGHTNIYDPLDNTLAAINYIRGRYGHPANIPNLGRPGYQGY